MSNISQTQCRKCGQIVFTVAGKMATMKDGTQFPQKYDDNLGTEGREHWRSCVVRKAEYVARKALETTPAQKATAESANMARDNVQKYGAGQKADEQPTIVVGDKTIPVADKPKLSKTAEENITEIKKMLFDMNNTIELIAKAVGVKLTVE